MINRQRIRKRISSQRKFLSVKFSKKKKKAHTNICIGFGFVWTQNIHIIDLLPLPQNAAATASTAAIYTSLQLFVLSLSSNVWGLNVFRILISKFFFILCFPHVHFTNMWIFCLRSFNTSVWSQILIDRYQDFFERTQINFNFLSSWIKNL